MKVKCTKVVDRTETECDPRDAEFVTIRVPQPDLGETIDHSLRKLPVIQSGTRSGTSCWTWNGDTEKPTFRPSVLVDVDYTEASMPNFRCHSFITNGMVHFLEDCSHEYVGSYKELLDLDGGDRIIKQLKELGCGEDAE